MSGSSVREITPAAARAGAAGHRFVTTIPEAPKGGRRPSLLWSIRSPIPVWLDASLIALTVLTPLALWIAFTLGEERQLFIPSPERTLQAAVKMWTEKGLWADITVSSARVAAAFVFGAVLGVPLGILMGAYRTAEAVIAPIVGTIRYMPVAAFIPLIILWVGIDEASKVLIIFMGIFFVNVIMVADAVKFVPAEMINAAYTLGATQGQVLRRVILPATLPSVIDTLRVNVSGAWNYLVIAELIASSQGLGFRIVRAQRFLQTDEIFVCILLIGAIGLALDLAFRVVSHLAVPWAHQR